MHALFCSFHCAEQRMELIHNPFGVLYPTIFFLSLFQWLDSMESLLPDHFFRNHKLQVIIT
ncbi:hypothetical protein CW304_13745 [Bacillus sp. UFRGS-B20]|nr:hypothetical protein CW304_13745 [Bacillus sp. UFRGS-B20]